MRQIFPDVKEGDRITGVQRPGEAARFFVNGQPRGEVRDAEFTRLFFGIWLSPRTSQPRLREALLGTQGGQLVNGSLAAMPAAASRPHPPAGATAGATG